MEPTAKGERRKGREKDSKDRHCWRSRTVMAKEFSKRAPSPAIATYGPLTTGANLARPIPLDPPGHWAPHTYAPPPAPPDRPTDRPQSQRIGHPEERAATRRDRGRRRVPNSHWPRRYDASPGGGGAPIAARAPAAFPGRGGLHVRTRGGLQVCGADASPGRARARGTHGQRGGELEFGVQREGGTSPPPPS